MSAAAAGCSPPPPTPSIGARPVHAATQHTRFEHTPTHGRSHKAHSKVHTQSTSREREEYSRRWHARQLEGASGGAGGEVLDRAADVASISKSFVALCRTCGARRCGLGGGLVEKKERQVGRGGRVGPCRTCDGVGHGSGVGGGGADTWDVASASAHVGRATASGPAPLSEVSSRHVGRGGRVGPGRTCDGGGGGCAVGGVGPIGRTWRPRRRMSDVRRRRRRVSRRRWRPHASGRVCFCTCGRKASGESTGAHVRPK